MTRRTWILLALIFYLCCLTYQVKVLAQNGGSSGDDSESQVDNSNTQQDGSSSQGGSSNLQGPSSSTDDDDDDQSNDKSNGQDDNDDDDNDSNTQNNGSTNTQGSTSSGSSDSTTESEDDNPKNCLTSITQEIRICIPEEGDYGDVFETAQAQFRNYMQGQIGLTGDNIIANSTNETYVDNDNQAFQVQQCRCNQIAILTLGLNVIPDSEQSSTQVLKQFIDNNLPQYIDEDLMDCSQYTYPTPQIGPCTVKDSSADCKEMQDVLRESKADLFIKLLDTVNSDAKNLGGEVTVFAPTNEAIENFMKEQNLDFGKLNQNQSEKLSKVTMNHILLDITKAIKSVGNDETLLTAVAQSPTKFYQCPKRGFVNVEKEGSEITLKAPGSQAKILDGLIDMPSCRNISISIIDDVLIPCPEGKIDNTKDIENQGGEGATAESVQNADANLDCAQEQQVFNCVYKDQNYTFARSEMYELFNCLADDTADSCNFRGKDLPKEEDNELDVIQTGTCQAECTLANGQTDPQFAPINVNAPVAYNTTEQDYTEEAEQSTSEDNSGGQDQLDATFANSDNCDVGDILVFQCQIGDEGTPQNIDNLVEDAYKGCSSLSPVPEVCNKLLNADVDGKGGTVQKYLEGTCSATCHDKQDRPRLKINDVITKQANSSEILNLINKESSALEESKANPSRLFSLVVNNTMYYPFFSEPKECSKQCGGGFKAVNPFCYSKDTGLLAPLDQCGGNMTAEILNILVTECNTQPCQGVNWTVGEWSSCSASCGDNTQQKRSITCFNYDEGIKVNDELCDTTEKPVDTRDCAKKSCDQVMWVTGDWGSCNNGRKTRKVTCQDFDNKEIPGEVCTEKLSYSRADSAECYDHIKGNPSSCPDHFVGYDCEIFTGDCSKADLKSGQICCNTGTVGSNGQCCQSGIADIHGQCCQLGGQGQIPAIDSQGECCTDSLDFAGVCGGNITQVDVYGQMCEGAIDASGVCCPSIEFLDDLGVCNGNNTDGVFGIEIRTNPRKIRDVDVPNFKISADFFKSEIENALKTYQYGDNKVNVESYDNNTQYRATFEGPLNRSLTYSNLYVLFDLQLSKFADLSSIHKKYRANNGVCEIGEFNNSQSDDCTKFSSYVKAENTEMCGEGGIFVKGTATCACFVGYEGKDCMNCSAGYIEKGEGTCILDSWGVKRLSESYNNKKLKGIIAGVVIGVVVFIAIVIGIIIFACICCRRRRRGGLMDTGKNGAKGPIVTGPGLGGPGFGGTFSRVFSKGRGYQRNKLGGNDMGARDLPISTNAMNEGVVANGNGASHRRNVNWTQNPVGGRVNEGHNIPDGINTHPSYENRLQSTLSMGRDTQGVGEKQPSFRDDEGLINFHDVDDDAPVGNKNNGVKPDMWIQNTSYNGRK